MGYPGVLWNEQGLNFPTRGQTSKSAHGKCPKMEVKNRKIAFFGIFVKMMSHAHGKSDIISASKVLGRFQRPIVTSFLSLKLRSEL